MRIPEHIPNAKIRITSTSFDSSEELHEKYPEFKDIKRQLDNFKQIRLLHQVNAWQLQDNFPGITFDLILWNHPHLGVEDFRLHRFLMAHFFHSSARHLCDSGHVSVTLVEGQEERWDLVAQAKRPGIGLHSLKRRPFVDNIFPGYICKRNKNSQSFKNTKTKLHVQGQMNSYVYFFQKEEPEQNMNVGDVVVNTTETSDLQGSSTPKVEKVEPSAQYECRSCARKFLTMRGLQTHTRQVHELKKYGTDWTPDRDEKLECKYCHRTYRDQQALWQHTVSKHGTYEISGPSAGPLEEELERLRKLDINPEFIPCDICGQAVPKVWHENQHLEMLKPLCGMKASCMVCEKVFIEHRAMMQHLNFCALKNSNQ
eukprot:m.284047 g.284047  ORF g.284047 m.284047 type:complete len:370 (+) comp16339_c3_seq12:1403-2512(+)